MTWLMPLRLSLSSPQIIPNEMLSTDRIRRYLPQWVKGLVILYMKGLVILYIKGLVILYMKGLVILYMKGLEFLINTVHISVKWFFGKQALSVFLSSLSVCLSVCSTEELGNTNGQLIVLLQKPHGASLGISLYGECVCPVQYCCLSNITVLAHSGSSTPGSPLWISRIRDAGIADRLVNHTLQQPWLPLLPRRSGALHVGDQLLSNQQLPHGRQDCAGG